MSLRRRHPPAAKVSSSIAARPHAGKTLMCMLAGLQTLLLLWLLLYLLLLLSRLLLLWVADTNCSIVHLILLFAD